MLNTANTTTGIYGRPDLFASKIYYSIGKPPTFWLVSGLTDAQRREALAIVQRDYDPIAYGTRLDGDKIKLYGAG